MKALTSVGFLFFSIAAFAYSGSPIPTGNGFGFASVKPDGTLINFYAHPYLYESRDPKNPNGKGIKTANFISTANWHTDVPSENFKTSYVSQSHIIQTTDGKLKANFFQPFTYQADVLITLADKPACLTVQWYNEVSSQTLMRNAVLFTFQEVKETLVAIPLTKDFSIKESDFCGEAWAFVSVEAGTSVDSAISKFNKWKGNDSAEQLLKRELKALEKWRVNPDIEFTSENEKNLWRQNEVILRMGQIREPYTETRKGNGLIVASLPDGYFFIPWVRDMTYATVGLIKSGHKEESQMAIRGYLSAGPIDIFDKEVNGYKYQISTTRYFGDGAEEADYSGQKYRNLEFDDWGLALWTLSEYYERFHDKDFLKTKAAHGSIYETARDYVVKPLIGNLDNYGDGKIVAKDTSIWEQNGETWKHYAYSTLAAMRGLKGFLRISKAMKDWETFSLVADATLALEKGFLAAYVHDDDIIGRLEDPERNRTDAAILEGINWSQVTDQHRIAKMLEKMQVLQTATGGYRRVPGEDPYEQQEFLYINFNLARVYLRQGRVNEANQIVSRMLEKANSDNGLIPEMYVSVPNDIYVGEFGDPTGAIPMVGYGAGMLTIYLWDRAEYAREN